MLIVTAVTKRTVGSLLGLVAEVTLVTIVIERVAISMCCQGQHFVRNSMAAKVSQHHQNIKDMNICSPFVSVAQSLETINTVD